jgi:hypothetical protein
MRRGTDRESLGWKRAATALGLLIAIAAGCGHDTPPAPEYGRPPQAGPVQKRVKLAVLPVESDQFPRVASGLNALFHDVQVKGVDDYFLSKVTLEVVQLSIECVEQTPACYQAVGKSLTAQRLLLGHIVAGAAPTRGKRKDRVPPVTVSVMLFDVESGTASHETSRTFKNEELAAAALGDVMKEVLEGTPAAQEKVGSGS